MAALVGRDPRVWAISVLRKAATELNVLTWGSVPLGDHRCDQSQTPARKKPRREAEAETRRAGERTRRKRWRHTRDLEDLQDPVSALLVLRRKGCETN